MLRPFGVLRETQHNAPLQRVFFMLTRRQQLTVQNLKKHQKLTTPEQIISYCNAQIAKPFWAHDMRDSVREGRPRLPKSKRSKRAHSYYQQIIDYYQEVIRTTPQ